MRRIRHAPVVLAWSAAILLTVAVATGYLPIATLRTFGLPGLALISLVSGASIEFAAPGYLTTIAYSLAYPALTVGITAGLATGTGELAKFVLGRATLGHLAPALRVRLDRLSSSWLGRNFLARPAVTLFAFAVVPNPFFDPLLVLAGLRGIRVRSCLVPVLLGKTVRCLILAYGTRAFSAHGAPHIGLEISPMGKMWSVSAFTFALGVLHYLYHALAKREAIGGFILSMTVFAAISQVGLLLTGSVGPFSDAYALATIVLLIVVVFQVLVFRDQERVTQAHFETLLRQTVPADHEAITTIWADTAVRLIGVDFYPEVNQHLPGWGSRDEMKHRFLRLLPAQDFNLAGLGTNDEERARSLEVPVPTRRWRWRTHVALFIVAWAIHLTYIGLTTLASGGH